MPSLAPILFLSVAGPGACSAFRRASTSPGPAATESGAFARVCYWRARPGTFDAYTRGVRDVAAPIGAEAQRDEAFMLAPDSEKRRRRGGILGDTPRPG